MFFLDNDKFNELLDIVADVVEVAICFDCPNKNKSDFDNNACDDCPKSLIKEDINKRLNNLA